MRDRRFRRPERYYVGRRPEATEVYVVGGTELRALPHPAYRSGAAFDWGRATAGALELAFAVLADTTRSRPPGLICQAFCAEVVARLEPGGFVMGSGDVAVWLLIAFSDG